MQYPTRICGAMTREGEPCQRATMKGGTRCSMHGGKSPLALQAAKETLAAAALPAAGVLFEVIENYKRTTCEVCGMPKGDPSPVIRAAQIVLDRTGFHPSMTLEVSRGASIPDWAQWLTSDQLTTIAGWIADAKQRMAAGAPAEDRLPTIDVPGVPVDDDEQGCSPTGNETPGEEE